MVKKRFRKIRVRKHPRRTKKGKTIVQRHTRNITQKLKKPIKIDAEDLSLTPEEIKIEFYNRYEKAFFTVSERELDAIENLLSLLGKGRYGTADIKAFRRIPDVSGVIAIDIDNFRIIIFENRITETKFKEHHPELKSYQEYSRINLNKGYYAYLIKSR